MLEGKKMLFNQLSEVLADIRATPFLSGGLVRERLSSAHV